MAKKRVYDTAAVLLFLRSAKDAAVQAHRHNQRAMDLWDACTRVTAAYSGMPGGGSKQTYDDKMVLYSAACEDELSALQEERKKQMAVAELVSRVPKDVHRYILQFRYLDYMSWPRVCVSLEGVGIYYTPGHIAKIHRAALQEAARIYEEMQNEDNTDKR